MMVLKQTNSTYHIVIELSYHVEVVADLGSFGQVPHVNVAIVAGRQHDAGVKWVSLQHKHLIIVALEQRERERVQTFSCFLHLFAE